MWFSSKLQQAGRGKSPSHNQAFPKKILLHWRHCLLRLRHIQQQSCQKAIKGTATESTTPPDASCTAHIVRNVNLSKHSRNCILLTTLKINTAHKQWAFPIPLQLRYHTLPASIKKKKKSLPVWREPVNSLRRYWANFNISRLHRFLQPLILSNKVFLWGQPEVFANKKTPKRQSLRGKFCLSLCHRLPPNSCGMSC